MIRIHSGLGLLIVLGWAAGLRADPLPITGPIPPDTLLRHTRQILEALDQLKSPLPSAADKELKTLLDAKFEDATQFSVQVQQLLDAHCLIGVSINPEGRVKAARGPAEPLLREGAERIFLVKVANDAGVTHPLAVSGPQIFAGDKGHGRWLEAAIVTPAPLRKTLTGEKLEYALIRLRPLESGKREATLGFDAGQGSQDLGFRAEVPILFTIK